MTDAPVAAAEGADLAANIVLEFYKTAEKLGAYSDLLSILGSFRDTLDDEEVLSMLRDWNEGKPMFKSVLCCVTAGSEACESCREKSVCSLSGAQKSAGEQPSSISSEG